MVGFTDSDIHQEVLRKGAKGLGIKCWKDLTLVCSNGIVPNGPLNDMPWTLGKYVQYNGGTQNWSKKVCQLARRLQMSSGRKEFLLHRIV